MHEVERKSGLDTWLRRTWSAVIRAAEVIEQSPMEVMSDRLDRLEREMVALTNRNTRIGDRT